MGQATNRFGIPLYWIDETHNVAGTEVTDYPVIIYKYDELVKRKISFELEGSDYLPIDTFGVGSYPDTNPGWGQAFIKKTPEGIELNYYDSQNGTLRQIKLTDSGIFISDLKYELTALNIASDSFQATYGSIIYDATLTKDINGRITKIS